MTAQQKLINYKINEIGKLNKKKCECDRRIQSNLEDIEVLKSIDPALSITKEDWEQLHKRINKEVER